MDIAEGDYIPDVAIGDDPLSKIFFISDGLLQMIRDKYKLKFARYVAEVAAAMNQMIQASSRMVCGKLIKRLFKSEIFIRPTTPNKKRCGKNRIGRNGYR